MLMERLFTTSVLTASLALFPASAQQPEVSPFLGSWAVDVAQLPVPPDARPRSVTFTFSDAGGGNWTTVVEIVAADGSLSLSEVTHSLDGTPAPVTNSIEADTVAVSMPEADVIIMALSHNGVPGSTRVFTIRPDGNSQIETAVYYSPEGVPAMRRAYFSRVR
jgi:hypothetical protein